MSITFSPDGVFLASGSSDKTIKLWDIQTGGIIRTFLGHKQQVSSISVSPDSTMIASGSGDKIFCLWESQTGDCSCVIQQHCYAHVHFFLTYPLSLIAISRNKVQEWDINGHQTGQEYAGSHITFSLDGTQLALCNKSVITVQYAKSREIIVKFHLESDTLNHCCFSPDGRFIAATVNHTAFVWDIACSDPHPIKKFLGYTSYIYALTFSSPLYSYLSI